MQARTMQTLAATFLMFAGQVVLDGCR